MKRMLSILMALLLLWSLALPAAAAETASTLRLEKTEGTVKVSNASGKSVSITEGMRLYSGYTIATGKNSYAYVSLDSTKAVKLDASSKVEVQKSGKKLELMLISGELFFNVTAPVEKDESLNIRTSTMVTGVRGTSGWVEAVNRFSSNVYLLEGTLTVTSTEPVTGQTRQTVITGGQTATATLTGFAQPGSQVTLTVTTLQEKQVPGFVAVEVKKDPALQKKITALSPLSVPEIIGDAEERLEAEQAAADLAQKEIKKQVESIDVEQAERVEQVFESPAAADDDDDDDEPYVPPTNITRELTNPTAAELKAALAETGVTRVNVINAGGDLSTASYTVASGQTLNIQSGTFTVGADQTLIVLPSGALIIDPGTTSATTLQVDGAATLNGETTNNGHMYVSGTVNINGDAINNGNITIASSNSVHVVQGSLTNNGMIQVGTDTQSGLLHIGGEGTLYNQEKGEIIIKYVDPDNPLSVNNIGRFINSGSFEVNDSDCVGYFRSSENYIENRDGLYAIAKRDVDSSTVYYLGLANKIPWNNLGGSTVTLIGAGSGTLSGGEVSAQGMKLDLNGKQATLSMPLQVSGGSLTIQDRSGGSGSLASASAEEGFDGSAVIEVGGGTVYVTGGKITSTNGTGIYVISSEPGGDTYESQSNVIISGNAEVEGATYGIWNDGGSVEISDSAVITLTGDVTVSDNGAASGYPVFGNAIFGDSVKLRAKDERCLTPYKGTSIHQEGDYYVLTSPTTPVKPV